jgi:D-arabinose 1-dehydrogenase-like Zn-dependent alcohol dehydrogenase
MCIRRGELPGVFPRTLGQEPVGDIASVGPGVRTRKVGDRVGVPWVQMTCGRCEWCARGKPIFCEKSIGTRVDIGGGHAEYMLAPVSPVDLITKRIRILGSQQNSREYLYEALQIAASGKVKVIAETYALDEVARAYDRAEHGQVRFRAVITT